MKIECPKCGFSREVDADKIPDKAKLATCPKCGHKFHFRNAEDEFELEDDRVQSEAGDQDQTGAAEQEDIWSKLESLDEDAAEQKPHSSAEAQSKERHAASPIPWEDLQTHGLVQGFWLTLKLVMFAPVQFFRAMPLENVFTQPLVFYLIVAEVQVLARFFWGLAGVVPQQTSGGMLGLGMFGGGSVLILFFYPVLMTVMVFFAAGLNHICLQAVKSGESGFAGTFKVVAYANGPMVLAVLPMIGPLAGMIWAVVCTFLGFKIVHRTTNFKVLAAMLLPVVLLLVISSLFFVVNGVSGVR
ncbi:MAG: zinc-ribbon domain-containing protein [Desulfohalobiaceae bacterium]|nr:zinc-ribbon domain-containing protein [Desulfohalobiaceae bacterium]